MLFKRSVVGDMAELAPFLPICATGGLPQALLLFAVVFVLVLYGQYRHRIPLGLIPVQRLAG